MRARPLFVAAVLSIAALVIGFVVSGHYLRLAAIGLDPSAFPAGELLQRIGELLMPGLQMALAGVVLAVGSLLIVALVAFFAVRASRRHALPAEPDADRRGFLGDGLAGAGAALAALALGGAGMFARAMGGVGSDGRGWGRPLREIFGGDVVKTHPVYEESWKGSRVQAYGRLGRTDWRVSDTVLGTGPLRGELGERIARLALERGVNYIDTAPDYSASGSEQAVGRAIKGWPRDRLFIATKWCTPTGHLPAGTPVWRYKQVILDSLARLGTGYVDLIHVHSCDEVERLMDPNMHRAFAELKQEGKARFLGFSSHTPNLVQVGSAAIDSGRFDVMMLAYHHGIWPEIGALIERARREQDMGVVAMKTLKGAKHRGLMELQQDAGSYAQAALKWVHADPNVSCAVISFFELQHVDEYLHASGRKPSPDDLALLERYDRAIAGEYCAPHCGVCLDHCPEGVPINDVLRHRMYFEDYRSEQQAMSLYAKLEVDAQACLGCDAPCAGACPFGIRIQERTIGAHRLLAPSRA